MALRRAPRASGARDRADEGVAAEAARFVKVVASLDDKGIGHSRGADGQVAVGGDGAAAYASRWVRPPARDGQRKLRIGDGRAIHFNVELVTADHFDLVGDLIPPILAVAHVALVLVLAAAGADDVGVDKVAPHAARVTVAVARLNHHRVVLAAVAQSEVVAARNALAAVGDRRHDPQRKGRAEDRLRAQRHLEHVFAVCLWLVKHLVQPVANVLDGREGALRPAQARADVVAALVPHIAEKVASKQREAGDDAGGGGFQRRRFVGRVHADARPGVRLAHLNREPVGRVWARHAGIGHAQLVLACSRGGVVASEAARVEDGDAPHHDGLLRLQQPAVDLADRRVVYRALFVAHPPEKHLEAKVRPVSPLRRNLAGVAMAIGSLYEELAALARVRRRQAIARERAQLRRHVRRRHLEQM